jgi:phosphoenolpyruvate-protein kinase (PTS system EI component)
MGTAIVRQCKETIRENFLKRQLLCLVRTAASGAKVILFPGILIGADK